MTLGTWVLVIAFASPQFAYFQSKSACEAALYHIAKNRILGGATEKEVMAFKKTAICIGP